MSKTRAVNCSFGQRLRAGPGKAGLPQRRWKAGAGLGRAAELALSRSRAQQ